LLLLHTKIDVDLDPKINPKERKNKVSCFQQLDGGLEAPPGAFNSSMEVQSKHECFFYNKNTICFNFCPQNPGSGSGS
jgi:hypothetical protein